MNIPSGGISDVERIEAQYPFLYFTRNHNPNGAGYGRFRGGDGSYRVYLVYGSEDLSVDCRVYGGVPTGFGLFGGFPCGTGGLRAIFRANPETVRARLRAGEYPTSPRQIVEEGWGETYAPQPGQHRVPLPEYWLVADFVHAGGGFGDPLEREPDAVARDVVAGIYTRWGAERFFGVVLGPGGGVDREATDHRREAERRARLAAARPATADDVGSADRSTAAATRAHPSLEVDGSGPTGRWVCARCRLQLGPAGESYLLGARIRVESLGDVSEYPLPAGEFRGEFHEYLCPGCATLLEVVYWPGETDG
jgi:N-methylhydantoinase B